jgi:uncharacterized protein YcfL
MKQKLIVAVASLALVGCMEVHEKKQQAAETVITGHRGGAYTARNANKYDLENRENFVLLDKGAEHSVTHAGIQSRVNPDGRLEIAANLRNRENRRIQVQVNCVFKDENGYAIDETPFQNLILTENAQETLRFISMNNQARRYTIRVREAR